MSFNLYIVWYWKPICEILSTFKTSRAFFFADWLSKRLLKISWDAIYLDCTYKTNHYRMSLCMIFRVTGLNTNFYIQFAFVSSKIYIHYCLVLSCFQEFYIEDDILNPIFARTDFKKTLIQALKIVFPQIKHELCIWYMDKNVFANCKPSFDTKNT